jgi:methionyl-tRNA formyltransferase
MTNISNPIVFFGTEDFSLIALQGLVEARFNVVAVVTKPDSPQGRGQKFTPPKVKVYATEHGIPVWQPTKLLEIADDVRTLNNPVGVLVSYGKIIPQSILDLFHPGIINVHPSLLPQYRGPSPMEATILNGDTSTAVSVMQLSAKMDAGPVYGYTPLELTGTETRTELYDTLGTLGTETLLKLLPLILNGEATGLAQDETQASYCQLITKADGNINWSKPAIQIEREIRAYHGWPQSRTNLKGIDIIITSAKVENNASLSLGELQITPDNGLQIGTGEGSLSHITVKPLGKKEMPVQAFLAGYRSQLGI